jgi:hypothetical protein
MATTLSIPQCVGRNRDPPCSEQGANRDEL